MDAVLADYREAPIPEAEKTLFAFVEKVNGNSAAITENDVAALRAAGWGDEAIYDAVNVIGLFNFYNRWIDATGAGEIPPTEYAHSGRRLAQRGYRLGPSRAVDAVESYFGALKKKDLSKAPFAEDVIFEGPWSPKLTGAKAVEEFLAGALPLIEDIRVQQHIAEGDCVASRVEIVTPAGAVPVFDYFRVRGGKIHEIRSFYDPRPFSRL